MGHARWASLVLVGYVRGGRIRVRHQDGRASCDVRSEAGPSRRGPRATGACELRGHTEVRCMPRGATSGWLGSHHDLAMQKATPETVLGNFNDVKVKHFKETARFVREGDAFFVEAVGADGERGRFPVIYTFGVEPLQQYLVEIEPGRLQSFLVCLGYAAERAGRSALVSPAARRIRGAGRRPTLDRTQLQLELLLRRLSFDGTQEELRSLDQALFDRVLRDRRRLRGLPRRRVSTRRARRGGRCCKRLSSGECRLRSTTSGARQAHLVVWRRQIHRIAEQVAAE